MNASQITMRAPSVARLASELHIDEGRARRIRDVWKRAHQPPRGATPGRGVRRLEIDAILETHGVELLGIRKRDGARVHYCNAGDSYAATLFFVGPVMRIGCVGDYAEGRRASIRFYNSHTGAFV